jgi:hypothetical protein
MGGRSGGTSGNSPKPNVIGRPRASAATRAGAVLVPVWSAELVALSVDLSDAVLSADFSDAVLSAELSNAVSLSQSLGRSPGLSSRTGGQKDWTNSSHVGLRSDRGSAGLSGSMLSGTSGSGASDRISLPISFLVLNLARPSTST